MYQGRKKLDDQFMSRFKSKSEILANFQNYVPVDNTVTLVFVYGRLICTWKLNQ